MLILHADWSTFLQEQYPELFKLKYNGNLPEKAYLSQA